MGGILHVFDDDLVDIHLDALFALVENDLHIILAVGIVAAKSGQHGLLDFFIHVFARNTLFLFQFLDGFKKFSVHCVIPLFISLRAALPAPSVSC